MNCNCKDCHKLTRNDWIEGACFALGLAVMITCIVMGA